MRDLNGNVLSSLATQFDSDAAAFITVANITSTTEITAINNLAKELKRNNIWDKMQAIYPFVGGTSASTRFNLKDPRDANDAFRLTFVGSWIYSSTGVRMSTVSTSNYIRTFYIPVSSATSNDMHVSNYVNSGTAGAAALIGTVVGPSPGSTSPTIIIYSSAVNAFSNIQARNVSDLLTALNTGGYHLGNRSASNSQQYYYNGALYTTSANTSLSLSSFTSDIYIMGRSIVGGTNDSPHSGETRFATIGTSLTSGENSVLYNLIQAFQTTLGRQVGTAITIPPRIESTIPTRLFGPRELFGSSLLTHVDTMDYKNFSTDRFNKVNPPNTGETVIQSIFDISPYGRRYNLLSAYTNVTETATTWTTTIPLTTTTQGFSASSFDTNKGTYPRADSYSIGQGHNQFTTPMASPYANFRNLAPNSAFTLCNWISHQGSQTNADASMGIGISSFNQATYILGLDVPQLNYGGNMLLTVKGVRQAPRYLPTVNNALTTMHLITVTGYNYYWYTNNVLYSSGTITGVTLYPFTTTGSTFFYLNSVPLITFVWGNNPIARTLEGFYATEYTTPEQVNLLYNYFIIKTKNKLGKFR